MCSAWKMLSARQRFASSYFKDEMMKNDNNKLQVTGVAGVMAARGLLENPAMYAGHLTTPASCVQVFSFLEKCSSYLVQDWVRLALSTGTHFTCFHHHLIYMLSSSLGKAERKAFNALTSTAAVLDYMQNHWGLNLAPSSHSEALL